jgi:hypothetical protein
MAKHGWFAGLLLCVLSVSVSGWAEAGAQPPVQNTHNTVQTPSGTEKITSRSPIMVSALPARCRVTRQPFASELGRTNTYRESGGKIEVVATARKSVNLPSFNIQVAVLDADDANCFYSQQIRDRGGHLQLALGFQRSNPRMDPRAVATFLRAQTYEFSSVTESR